MQKNSVVSNIYLSMKKRNSDLHGLFYLILVSSLVSLAFYPLMSRSLWVDEAMLFRNYPIENFSEIFLPLRYYDQAATPLYSLFASLIATLDISTGRYASTLFIVSAIVWLLTYRQSSAVTLFVAILGAFAFYSPLIMYSEFKHYGFEVIGVLISIRWFLFKKNTDALNSKDVLILFSSLTFGISTLITSTVTICIFLFKKYLSLKKIISKDFIYLFFFIGIAITYYLLIKKVTVFQIENYVDAYSNKGFIGNLKALLAAGFGVVGKQGIVLVSLATALLFTALKDIQVQRLLLLSVVTAFAFFVASALGLYPATNARHMNWSAGFYVALIFYGIKSNLDHKRRLPKLIAITLCILLTLIISRSIYNVHNNNVENTENNIAISFIRDLPPSIVGLWIGGQPVIEYYQKIYPDLSKHSYFGLINVESDRIDLKNQKSSFDDYDYSEFKDKKGAWGRMVMFRIMNDYSVPARSLLNQLPRGKDFYIFASHYDVQAKDGYSVMRVIALHEELKNKNCSFSVIKQLRNLSIYQVACV